MKSGRTRSNRGLGLLLLDLAYLLTTMILYKGGYLDANLIRLIMTPALFTVGPLFFSYIKRYASNTSPSFSQVAIHCIPAFLVILYYLPKFFSPEWMPFLNYRIMTYVFWYAILVHFMVYLFISAGILRKIKRLTGYITDETDPTGAWFRFLMRFFFTSFMVMLTVTVYDMARLSIGFKGQRPTEVGIALFGVVLICAVSFKGLKSPVIFFSLHEKKEEKKPVISIDERRLKEILEKARFVMERDKPYLHPQLTLPELAVKAGVPRGDLSQAINAGTKLNFYDYINAYRVDYAKSLLTANRALSVLDAACQSGFRSKSTFNEAFKKRTGCTPSEYRNSSGVD